MDLVIFFGILIVIKNSCSQEEWRWKNKNRSPQARYDVVEETDETGFEPSFGPPPHNNNPIYRPIPNPIQQGGSSFYPSGGFGSNFQNPGILTGPSSSSQRGLQKFDRCKCAESFNCNTPGISYGVCDIGKQYCCYRSKQSRFLTEPIPNRPVHSIANGVLFGPDNVGQNFNRPGLGQFGTNYYGGGNTYSIENGILSGPQGPVDYARSA